MDSVDMKSAGLLDATCRDARRAWAECEEIRVAIWKSRRRSSMGSTNVCHFENPFEQSSMARASIGQDGSPKQSMRDSETDLSALDVDSAEVLCQGNGLPGIDRLVLMNCHAADDGQSNG